MMEWKGGPVYILTRIQSDYAQLILEKPLYALMKLSVLFFYRRIFTSEARFMRFNAFMIGLISVWSFTYFIVEIFQCSLVPWELWTPGSSTDACVNRTWLNFTYAITDVIGDVLVVSMPFPVIRHLMMDRRQKAGVAFIFLLGAISTAAAMARLVFISIAFTQNYGAIGVNTHAATTPPSVWSTVEGSVGLLAACLPPLGPLLRRVPRAPKASVEMYNRYRSRKGYTPTASVGSLSHSEPGIATSPARPMYDSWGAPIRNDSRQFSQPSRVVHSQTSRTGHSHQESRQLSQTSRLQASQDAFRQDSRGNWKPPV
jgi:hypothetical protein